MSSRVWIRRVYDPPTHNDGHRVLVDRLWPRGVSREKADIDDWFRDMAPSDELRKWFGHDPELFAEFRRRYRAEMEMPKARAEVDRLVELVGNGRVTLVYAAHDQDHNNAVVIRELVDELVAQPAR